MLGTGEESMIATCCICSFWHSSAVSCRRRRATAEPRCGASSFALSASASDSERAFGVSAPSRNHTEHCHSRRRYSMQIQSFGAIPPQRCPQTWDRQDLRSLGRGAVVHRRPGLCRLAAHLNDGFSPQARARWRFSRAMPQHMRSRVLAGKSDLHC